MKAKILLIEDNEQNRYLVTFLLEQHGHDVVPAVSGPLGLDLAAKIRPDLILLDIRSLQEDIARRQQVETALKVALIVLDLIMPEVGRKQRLEGLLSLNPSVKVVVASGCSAVGHTKGVLGIGAKGFVNKPYDIWQMLEAVRSVLDEEQGTP